MRADEIKTVLKEIDLGERIVAFRLQKGWTQGDLAQICRSNARHLSQLENDQLVPTPRVVRKLAYALDVSTEELLMGPLPTRSSSRSTAVA